MSSAGNAIYSAAALFRLVKAIVKEAHRERRRRGENEKKQKQGTNQVTLGERARQRGKTEEVNGEQGSRAYVSEENETKSKSQ